MNKQHNLALVERVEGSEGMLLVRVEIRDRKNNLLRRYVMDHNDGAQRRVLGMHCRACFEAGQSVSTVPLNG